MAASYTAYSTDSRTTNFTSISGNPVTLSAWVNAPGDHNGLLSIGDTNANGGENSQRLIINAGNARAMSEPTTSASSIGTVSANTWVHICGVFSANNSRTAYLNGTAGTTETTTVTPNSWDAIGIACRPSGSGWAVGITNTQIAEAAIWNAALTADEVTSLAKGFSPRRVRPQSLRFYAPLVRDFVHIAKDGFVLTNTGSPTVAVHPRIY